MLPQLYSCSQFLQVLDADAKQRQHKRTREAIESKIKGLGDSVLSSSASATNTAKFVKYAAAGLNSQRVVKVQSIQEDPMNPATLKLKKVENRSTLLRCSNLSTI